MRTLSPERTQALLPLSIMINTVEVTLFLLCIPVSAAAEVPLPRRTARRLIPNGNSVAMEVQSHGNLMHSDDHPATKSAGPALEENADRWSSRKKLLKISSTAHKQGHQFVDGRQIVFSSPHFQDNDENVMEAGIENQWFGTKSVGLKLKHPKDSSSLISVSSNGEALLTEITQENPTVNGISGITPAAALDIAAASLQFSSPTAIANVQAGTTAASLPNSAPSATLASPDQGYIILVRPTSYPLWCSWSLNHILSIQVLAPPPSTCPPPSLLQMCIQSFP